MKLSHVTIAFLALVSCSTSQWLVPVPDSTIDTLCWRRDGSEGIHKLAKDCNGDKSQFVGFISSRNSILVCCSTPPRVTQTTKTTITTTKAPKIVKVGDEARSYCTINRSSTFDVLSNKHKEFSEIAIQDGEFPHMATLGFEDSDGGVKFECGGALISESFVLSAAHCLLRGNPKLVRLGQTRIDLDDTNSSLDVVVKRSIRHDHYNMRRKYDDIALVELAESVRFTAYIKPVCLQVESDIYERNRNLTVIEFEISNFETSVSDNLNSEGKLTKGLLIEVGLGECRERYSKVRLSSLSNNISSSQLCAQYSKKSTMSGPCKGDSGSPVQHIAADGRYYLVGVTSFGLGCGSSFPSIFTRVSEYISWIEKKVWPRPKTWLTKSRVRKTLKSLQFT